jgi:hypothetical protein
MPQAAEGGKGRLPMGVWGKAAGGQRRREASEHPRRAQARLPEAPNMAGRLWRKNAAVGPRDIEIKDSEGSRACQRRPVRSTGSKRRKPDAGRAGEPAPGMRSFYDRNGVGWVRWCAFPPGSREGSTPEAATQNPCFTGDTGEDTDLMGLKTRVCYRLGWCGSSGAIKVSLRSSNVRLRW